ncbi:peptidyl-prolyl cis-trans isomerase-like 2 [Aspergillus arachidicola]|uniref:Enhancer of mRNA-decapping protein 3 n=1 Tax=Aspergillus arachidicola TaxID=656916 RepID=A0A2G7FQ34_9EURO|nr:peptidyl-prolyl cis-trans isomerase-like 2 [Aspergillus arachidicola]
MASEFIGYNVLVTLRTPPNATVQGVVANVIGQRLMLRDVALSWSPQKFPTYFIEAADIADLSLGPNPSAPSHNQQAGRETHNLARVAPAIPAQQSFVDPAILSFSKPSSEQFSQAARTGGPQLQHAPNDRLSSPASQNIHPPPQVHRDQSAVLTEPFSNLELNVEGRATEPRNAPQENELHGSIPAGKDDFTTAPRSATQANPKGGRRVGQNKSQRAGLTPVNEHDEENRGSFAEDPSGWATEDATDIQELGDFDFQSNLSKFDKRRVFEEIRNDDTTADEERLVSFNRRVPKPGTNGGKNLHWTENVLDSPLGSETGDTDQEPSDAKLSSGNYSGRELSRGSARAQSRKGSGILGQPLVPPQINTVGRGQLSASRTTSPRPGSKASVSASPISGPGVPGASLRLTTTNRSCPTVSPLQALEVEQIAVAELGLTEDMITENAGRSIAEAAVGLLSNDAAAPTMLVLTGNHRTGARAVSAARHLRNRGHRVTVCMLGIEHENELLESCRKQIDVFKKIGGRVHRWEDLSTRLSTSEFSPDLVLDALFGIHIAFDDLRTDDQAVAFEMIAWANRSNLEVLSVDVPSGFSASSGEVTVMEGGRTDKLYITHSEWASGDSYSASAGAGGGKGGDNAPFKRLPFNFCSLSLQPFAHPVCTPSGTIFDLTNILPWIKKHGKNPVDGTPLKNSDLIKLNIAKNESGDYVDPVTYKVLTDNTHIVALRNTGNVFAWDTVERLNIKGKLWRDLVTDEEFGRKDIITLQDPQNIESRNLSSFNYLKEGESVPGQKEEESNVNASALGSSAKILKAKEAVAKARSERAQRADSSAVAKKADGSTTASTQSKTASFQSGKPTPYNAAKYTTGMAAASFTSTGLTPHTSAELALLSDEEYMLKRGRVKQKGYARISTTSGDINLELQTEYAPKAVWNFIKLAKKGYYKDVTFHRNIKGFMIQGGDPSGTGRGGESIWGKYFNDEFEGPLKHDSRGTLSMANKGKNTNSSQFFIAYRALPHLNNKHTIFGHVIDDPTPSSTTLNNLETHPVNSSTNRPTPDIRITDVTIFVDPFEEFLNQKKAEEASGKNKKADPTEEDRETQQEDDDQVTWTGKRVRGPGSTGAGGDAGSGVGKYLKAALANQATQEEDEIVEFIDEEPEPEPVRKKFKSRGGFGDFSSWD